MVDPLDYFRECVDNFATFRPLAFDCEDMNLRAFCSKEVYRKWFGQPPAPRGTPYRDNGFYTRELAEASLRIKPRRIVEIGTDVGRGTLMLAILNPGAVITSVDNRMHVPTGDGKEYEVGFIARHNGVAYEQIIGDSAKHWFSGVDMFFIDGNHSFDAVTEDSENAIAGANPRGIIVWHDYSDECPGCRSAIGEFCLRHNLELRVLPDSSTVSAEIDRP